MEKKVKVYINKLYIFKALKENYLKIYFYRVSDFQQ